jgi:large conductance mechanosensitive channel
MLKDFFKEFRQFLLRGNVVDLAVGVVIGAAFNAVVLALVADFFTPLIAAIVQIPNFADLSFTIHGSKFLYGNFVNAVIALLLDAVAIFFFIVKPINLLVERSHKEPPADPTTKKCRECLSEIPLEARRCAHCTQVQPMP